MTSTYFWTPSAAQREETASRPSQPWKKWRALKRKTKPDPEPHYWWEDMA